MESVDVVKRFFECMATKNVEGLDEVVGEDIRNFSSRGTIEGKKAFIESRQQVMVTAAPIRPQRHIAQGEWVASIVEVRDPPARLVDIFHVTDGKIREMTAYPFRPFAPSDTESR